MTCIVKNRLAIRPSRYIFDFVCMTITEGIVIFPRWVGEREIGGAPAHLQPKGSVYACQYHPPEHV